MRRFRVIQGGKSETVDTDTRRRLYRTYSTVDLTKGEIVYYDVEVSWYCLERTNLSNPYPELITVSSEIRGELRESLEKAVSRCFWGEEADALERYLWERYGMGMKRLEVQLPLKQRISFFEDANNVVYDFLELSEKDGYPLPFKVWGYYSLRDSLASSSLECGVRFLRKALERLHLGGISDAQLETIARALYDDEALVVTNRLERS